MDGTHRHRSPYHHGLLCDFVRERTSAPGTSDGRYVHLNESVTGQTLCPSRRYTISSRGTCPTGDPQGGTAVHMARSVVTGVLLVPDTHRIFPRGDEISSTICTEPGVDDFRAVKTPAALFSMSGLDLRCLSGGRKVTGGLYLRID